LKCLQKRSLSQPFVSNRAKPGILPLSYPTQYIEKHKNVKYSGQLKLFPEYPSLRGGYREYKEKLPECPFVMELASSKLWIGKQAAKERNKK